MTWELLGGSFIAAFTILLLYALFQYSVHGRKGPLKLVVWICAVALVLGGLAALGAWLIVLLVFGIMIPVGIYFLIWYLPGKYSRGWLCHLLRAVLVGGLWGVHLLFAYLISGPRGPVPGDLLTLFLLCGLVAGGLSALDARRREPHALLRRERRVLAAGVLLFTWCVNWCIACTINPSKAAANAPLGVIRYLSWSRPGIACSRDRHGRTPLSVALNCGRRDVVGYWSGYLDLAQGADGDGVLHQAVRRADLRMIEYLLDLGADPDFRSPPGQSGRTALHLAAGMGQEDVVRLLLARGADPRLKDYRGWTAGQWAAACRHPEIEALLASPGNRE